MVVSNNNYYILKAFSFNKLTLSLYITFLKTLLNKLNIKYSIIFLPVKKSRITLLKSPHVNKKAREQFQVNKFSFLLKFQLFNNYNALNIITLNKPKVVKTSLKIKN